MSSITQGRGGRGGGRESSQGRGGRGYTHSNWRPVRGRGSSSVPQQQQPAIPAGGREAIPKLVYGINTNYHKWLEKITAYAVQIYNADGMFFHTGAYTNYPLVQIGEGYGAEDLEPDNDPGGILRDTILKENAIALQNRNAAGRNKLAIFALMWDTISRESQEAVMQRASEQPEDGENAGDHETLQIRADPLLLLTYLRSTHLIPATGARLFDQQAARTVYENLRQRRSESVYEYKQRFQDAVDAMTLHGLPAPLQPELATRFLSTLDQKRFGEFQIEIYNDATMRGIQPPQTLVDAFQKASRYLTLGRMSSGAAGSGGHDAGPFTNAVFAFTTGRGRRGKHKGRERGGGGSSETPPAAAPAEDQGGAGDRRSSAGRACYLCGQEGHFMSGCPMRQQFHEFRAQQQATAGGSLVRNHVVTTTSVEPQGGVSLDLLERRIFVFGSRPTPCGCNAGHPVILDNAASVSVIRDKQLLSNIRTAAKTIDVSGISPGGSITLGQVGEFFDLGTVYYSAQATANVLSLAEMEDRHEVIYNSGESFELVLPSGDVISFLRRPTNHFVAYFPPRDLAATCPILVTTEMNEALYTKREVEGAKAARRLQELLGYPSMKDLIKLLSTGAILNTEVTVKDAIRAQHIYGPSIPALKGKTKIMQARGIKVEHIPRPIFAALVLHVDTFFVQGEPYLLSVSTPPPLG